MNLIAKPARTAQRRSTGGRSAMDGAIMLAAIAFAFIFVGSFVFGFL
jgi:hypothetical protein